VRKGALFLLPLLLASLAARANEPRRLEIAEKDFPTPSTDWYGVYGAQEQKVGFARMELAREGGRWIQRQRIEIHTESMGKRVDLVVEQEDRFLDTAPFGWEGMSLELGPQTTRAEVKEGKVLITTSSAAGSHTTEQPLPDYNFLDALSAWAWIRSGPKEGESITTRTFNPLTASVDPQTVKIVGSTETTVNGVATRIYEAQLSTAKMGPVGASRFSGDGRAMSATFGGFFSLRLEPEEVAKDIGKGGDLFVSGFAKVDRNLGDPKSLRDLVLVARGEGAKSLQPGPRQAVRAGEEPGTVLVTLGPGSGSRLAATEAEIAESLVATMEFPTGDPAVKALAAAAVGDAATPREKADRLVHFVNEYVEDILRPEIAPVLQVVKDRRGDCSEHSFLFVTLARAAGLPARLVFGLIYMGDMVRAFGGHAWCEVAIDGEWVPVDPTWDEVEINPAHIRSGAGVAAYTASLWTLGRVEFTVQSMTSAE
jgi:hypothetical protein